MLPMDSTLALVAVGASTILAFGCTPSTPAPPSLPRDSAVARSVFTDTAVYRRYCVVAAGRPVDLTQPCFLLDQGRQPERRPPGLLP
jgi:hypothetical protein